MIFVVTDSTADIPADLAAQWNIRVIPAIVVMDGKEFQDGVDLSRESFYERLPDLDTPATTSAPSSGSIEAVYRECFAAGAEEVLSLHVAGSLSAICGAAQIAAEPFSGRVRVVDSGQLSMGLGFQVLTAAEAAASGAGMAEALAEVGRLRRRLQVVAMLDTLEYLRRGGRVSQVRASIGAALKMRVFIELHEGKVNLLEQVRTRGNAMRRLWDYVVSLGRVEQFALLHANAEEDARELLARLGPDMPRVVHLVNVNTVIGTHVGPGAIGYAAVVRGLS